MRLPAEPTSRTALCALVATVLLTAACGGAQPCPEVDEEAIAEQVAEIVLERLEAEARAEEARGRIAGPIEERGSEQADTVDVIETDVESDDHEEDEEDLEIYAVPVDGSPALGPSDALVTVVFFADIQCPFCDTAYRTVRTIRERFGDEMRLVWKNHPLPMHKEAMLAHHALMEARAQKGDEAAFAMLELMFEDMTHLERRDLERHARQLKLSLPRFRRALRREKHAEAIERDLELARRVGIRGTPTFFVNGVKIVGAASYYTVFHAVSDALERAQKMVRAGVPRHRIYEDIIRDGLGGARER